MLRIRLTRTGKKQQPSFRIVVAEHGRPVKSKYIEFLGNYVPAAKPKQITIKKDRIEYWIQNGAKPSDTVASLLKREGFANMDQYIENRDKKRKKKKGGDEPEESEAPAAEASAEKPAEAPAEAESKAEAKEEAPAA